MHIQKIDIKNFRLLKEVNLSLEKQTTVIVGRNNSGKTSLTDLMQCFLSTAKPRFQLEDFSLAVLDDFKKACVAHANGEEEPAIRNALPFIEARLTLGYEKFEPSLGSLEEFIIDLDPDCTEALIVIRYELAAGKIEALFEGLNPDAGNDGFLQMLRGRIPSLFTDLVYAEDPNDHTNQKVMERAALLALLQGEFIDANRTLTDQKDREKGELGKILSALVETARHDGSDPKDHDTVERLEGAVEGVQKTIGDEFKKSLDALLPTIEEFGYPGLSNPNLETETQLDVQKLLEGHTKLRYHGVDGMTLPETYSGLGVRNLIFILLKLRQFFKSFQARPSAPGVQLIFIEEPEAHLHPQMQEVFIRKLGDVVKEFSKKFNDGKPWPVQFVVSTHSSHVANEAPFRDIRYFLTTPNGAEGKFQETRIKDLQSGFGETLEDTNFLHQYITLTRCDLFFADKAVLIEGTTERLLLTAMIKKVDEVDLNTPNLSSQYLSILEVGGAYAHKFFKLLDFLELPSLIITDIDSAKKEAKGHATAKRVSESNRTTNASIKNWFDNAEISPTDLIAMPFDTKISAISCLAYQVPHKEGDPCGRSFEDAFILANPELFQLKGDREKEAWDIAQKEKKSAFALKYAIDEPKWTVPRYIAEGLTWLASISDTPPAAEKAAKAPALQPTPAPQAAPVAETD